MAKHFIYFISAFFFCISLCLLENLKRLRNELRNGLTHNSECTHTHIGTVLAKFFIPIYRCIISLLFPSFLLSKWFLLTFCARYTASHQPDQGEPHSSHACPFPCTPLPLPLPLPLPHLSFHLLCHCELETPAHSSKRTEPNRTGRQLHAMRKCPQRRQRRHGGGGRGRGATLARLVIFSHSSRKLFLVEVCLLIVRRKQATD